MPVLVLMSWTYLGRDSAQIPVEPGASADRATEAYALRVEDSNLHSRGQDPVACR
jgi:hypothetical protein